MRITKKKKVIDPINEKVFVVHGRNDQLRRDFFSFLRSIHLQPIEWSKAITMTGSSSPYIGEILDAAFNNAQVVIVLLSPDDEVKLKKKYHKNNESEIEKKLTGQARPNVLFEAGMAIGRDHERTLFIEMGDVKKFSDVIGRHMIKLDNSFQTRHEIINRLKTAGCQVDTSGADWQSIGNFNFNFKNIIKYKSNSGNKLKKTKSKDKSNEEINVKSTGIIPMITKHFHLEFFEWARLIFQLGNADFKWTKQKTLLSKTNVESYHLKQFVMLRPEIIETKRGKEDTFYKLTEEAKKDFLEINKSLKPQDSILGKFINQNNPPKLTPNHESNDHYFDNKNPIDLTKFDIKLSIKTSVDYWRCGIRFSKDKNFKKGRHETCPCYGVYKNDGQNVMIVFFYDENAAYEDIANFLSENKWINIFITTSNGRTIIKTSELRDSIKEIDGYKYCQILGWGDENPFEIDYELKLIKK